MQPDAVQRRNKRFECRLILLGALRMTLSEQDILRIVMKTRDRIAAAAWIVVRDAHAAEDIFQNVTLKALKQEVHFPAEGALLSWAFITARRAASRISRCRNEQYE